MTIPTSIADMVPDLVAFRRDIHAHPELGFCEHRTAGAIAGFLRGQGIEVHEGVGQTGVVGVLRNGRSDQAIGLRADMDALPMQEKTGLPYASRHPGSFHGCGHDGHVAMLLGAAQYLAHSRSFNGTVNFIFQPAEEGQGGGRAMVEDGLFTRFPCDSVYGIHNWPDLPAGVIATRPGPIMGAADRFEVVLRGKGGHAAIPHSTPDAILAASVLVQQLNTIVSRSIDPNHAAVLSVTMIHGGEVHNVIPDTVTVTGTVRSFERQVQEQIEQAIRQMAQGVAASFALAAEVAYDRYYPATINDADCAMRVLEIAAGVGQAELAPHPAFTSEDFAYLLQQRPGAYIWLGQKVDANSPSLHSPHYDFNDNVLEIGMRLHIALAEQLLA